MVRSPFQLTPAIFLLFLFVMLLRILKKVYVFLLEINEVVVGVFVLLAIYFYHLGFCLFFSFDAH